MDWIFRQQCGVRTYLGVDGWGQRAHSEPVTVSCRWQAKQQLVRARHGDEVMAQTEVWLPIDIHLGPEDLLVYGGHEYRILNTGEGVDLAGRTVYRKVWC